MDKQKIDGQIARRVILIDGNIDEEVASSVAMVVKGLVLEGSPNIKVLITSQGGVQRFGVDIYDSLSAYEGYKTAVVWNYALSCGVLPLLACNLKQALPHSRLLFNTGALPNGVTAAMLRNPEWVQQATKSLEEGDDVFRKIISDSTSLSEKQVSQLLSREGNLTAEEACQMGLLDEVLVRPLFEEEGFPQQLSGVTT